MFSNPKKDFDNRIKELLKDIYEQKLSCDLSQKDLHILKECLNNGYISGIEIYQDDYSGNFRLIKHSTINIEKPGLNLLYPKRNWALIITTIASVITAIATVATAICTIAMSK